MCVVCRRAHSQHCLVVTPVTSSLREKLNWKHTHTHTNTPNYCNLVAHVIQGLITYS